MWALRDAVAAAGHYASGHHANAFYRRLAGEINAACDDGSLSCLPFRATMAPPFRWHYVTDALAVVPALLRTLVTVGNAEVGSSASSGPHIEFMAQLVGPDLARLRPRRLPLKNFAGFNSPWRASSRGRIQASFRRCRSWHQSASFWPSCCNASVHCRQGC